MALQRLTKNTKPSKIPYGDLPVTAEIFNKVVDEVNGLIDGSIETTSLTVETLEATTSIATDTITESTSDAGVTIDGVLMKDNRVKSGGGTVASPGVQVGSADTGLYAVSGTQTGYSQDGVLVALFDGDGFMADTVRPRIEPVTANTGVTAQSYGDGVNFTTVLTVSKTDAITVADNAALADGYKLMDFPAGAIVVTAAYMSMGVTLAEDTTATPDVGLGTTIGSGANNVLSGVGAGAENILTGQTATNCTGTATVKTVANQPLVIEVGDSHSLYFNVADTWADTAGSDLDGDIAGTVTIKWTLMA